MSEQIRRASRLVEIEHLLRQHPAGLTVREMASRLRFSTRTIQRDVAVLESELGVPLEVSQRRYRILPGSAPIGQVRLTLQEGRAVYLAFRMFLSHADERDPDALEALAKIADALPPAIGQHAVGSGVQHAKRGKANKAYTTALRTLTTAWADCTTVLMRYRSSGAVTDRAVYLDPYLLEPTADGSSTYVIGYSHAHGEVRTFKVDRISSIELTKDSFQPRQIAEVRAQMAQSWGGIVLAGDQHDVVLDFSPEVARRVAETTWHPSQRITQREDGSLRFEVRLPSLLEFIPWVRSWGAAVKVIGPAVLVQEISEGYRAAAALYG